MGGLWGATSTIAVSFSTTVLNPSVGLTECPADCDGLVIRIFPRGSTGDTIILNGFSLTIVAYTGPPA